MSDKKILSLTDIKVKNTVRYEEVEAYGGTVRIGSVSSAQMLDWVAENSDEKLKTTAGLRLLVRSIVDEDGERFPEADHEGLVEIFRNKDARDNGLVIRAALELNGLERAAKKLDDAKNV